MLIESLQGLEKAFYFLCPWQRFGIMPRLLSLRDGKRPVKKIAHMGQDLPGLPAVISRSERCETFRHIAHGLVGAISQGGNGVPQKLPAGIVCRLRCCCHGCSYCALVTKGDFSRIDRRGQAAAAFLLRL